ncbi:DNA replication ATP-dependent helicase/nuclease DNA2-like protein [Dinothrombium tinctorium]|uniref:DNA helicase n=1 Tax=Dinothrombium tinctorium TaxID=1965070 RepID=A0A443QQ89_9ACAR|nr:DNA replication ATP-dependent helicase/nuclease DNA2-like protein [Dinothrombium tinctorium]
MAPRKIAAKASGNKQLKIDCFFKRAVKLECGANAVVENEAKQTVPIIANAANEDDDIIFEKRVIVTSSGSGCETPKSQKRDLKRKRSKSSTTPRKDLKRTPLNNNNANTSGDSSGFFSPMGWFASPVNGKLSITRRTSTPLNENEAVSSSRELRKKSLFSVASSEQSSFTKLKLKSKQQENDNCQIIDRFNEKKEDRLSNTSSTASETLAHEVTLNKCDEGSDAIFEEETVDGSEFQEREISKNVANIEEKSKDENSSKNDASEISKKLSELSPFVPDVEFNSDVFRTFYVSAVEKEDRQIKLKLQYQTHTFDCVIRGLWSSTCINVGDYINIKTKNYEKNTFFIDDNEGTLVLKPETMVSCTSMSSSVFCMRKAWLSQKFTGWCSSNKYMLVGSIVHQLFQTACVERIKTEQELNNLALKLTQNSQVFLDCYANNITTDQLMSELALYIPNIAQWLSKYMFNGPSRINDESNEQMQLLKVHDIEDNFWVPTYGLKGKIDVSLKVKIHDNKKKNEVNVPLEIKTGRPSFSFEHQGQVSLYAIMMDSTEYAPCDSGLLLYLKDKPQMKRVQVKSREKRSLIQTRNDLVHYFGDLKIGPPPKNSENLCSKCDSLLPCSLMFKAFGSNHFEDSQIMSEKIVPHAANHLNQEHIDFFKKWVSMLHLEMSYTNNYEHSTERLDFWNETSEERESNGLCFAKMVIKNRIGSVYTLKRKHFRTSENQLNHSKNRIRIADRVALSFDDETKSKEVRIAFATGYVSKLTEDFVEVTSDKILDRSFHERIIRIDYIPNENTFSFYFSNLLHLMLFDERPLQLRRFIIDGHPPDFQKGVHKKIVSICKTIIRPLNKSQQRAVLRSVTANDYVLICGTPGAGKTTTIVSIVRLLAEIGKSVLITSYTHSALDNILLKLKNFDVKFIRLGNLSKMHPELIQFSDSNQLERVKSVEELKILYSSIPVVATTSLSTSHPIFEARTFDYCLLDEASQVNLLASLGPLFYSTKFILVGDSKQLPPVVKCKEAKELGFDQSLFSLLQNEDNTVYLTIQYRMNREIMRVASALMYENTLECATEEVAISTLNKPSDTNFAKKWMATVLSHELQHSFLFANTDRVPAKHQEDEKGLVSNEVEALIVKQLVDTLLINYQLVSSEIGVIAPYNKQVEILREMTKHCNVEVNTVDKYQGRDKDVIIISTVLSSDDCKMKDLLQDVRRINVAITRARKKLIIVGSRQTLLYYKPFQDLLLILRKDQIYELPKDAHL